MTDPVRDWRSEDHDPQCESRLMGRCDCSRYIVVDCARRFKADLAAIIRTEPKEPKS